MLTKVNPYRMGEVRLTLIFYSFIICLSNYVGQVCSDISRNCCLKISHKIIFDLLHEEYEVMIVFLSLCLIGLQLFYEQS